MGKLLTGPLSRAAEVALAGFAACADDKGVIDWPAFEAFTEEARRDDRSLPIFWRKALEELRGHRYADTRIPADERHRIVRNSITELGRKHARELGYRTTTDNSETIPSGPRSRPSALAERAQG